jgi:multisubunit Na+/H+ antiporter MnhF subunit
MKKKDLPIPLFIHLALYGFLCLYYMFNRPHWAYELDGGVSSYFETAIVVLFLVNLFLLYRFFRSNSATKSVRVCSIAGLVLLLVFSVCCVNAYRSYNYCFSSSYHLVEIDDKIELDGRKAIVVNNMRILCSESEYSLIQYGQPYIISCTYFKPDPTLARLDWIYESPVEFPIE